MTSDDLERRLRDAMKFASDQIFGPPPNPATVKQTVSRAMGIRTNSLLPALAAVSIVAVTVVVAFLTFRTGPTEVPTYQGPAKPSPTVASDQSIPPGTPICRQDQLIAYFRGGGFETGNVFGTIDLVNQSEATCQLNGQLSITPVDANGDELPVQRSWRSDVELRHIPVTADGIRPDPNGLAAPSQQWAELVLGGVARDYSGGGARCPAGKTAVPAGWALGGIVDVTIPNDDNRIDPGARGRSSHIFSCLVGDALQLLNVAVVAAP